jgi:hypothetical protein
MKLKRQVEEQGRAEVEISARDCKDRHLDGKEDSLGKAYCEVEQIKLSNTSGHDVSGHNGDWLAWTGFAFWLVCLAARDHWVAGWDWLSGYAGWLAWLAACLT